MPVIAWAAWWALACAGTAQTHTDGPDHFTLDGEFTAREIAFLPDQTGVSLEQWAKGLDGDGFVARVGDTCPNGSPHYAEQGLRFGSSGLVTWIFDAMIQCSTPTDTPYHHENDYARITWLREEPVQVSASLVRVDQVYDVVDLRPDYMLTYDHEADAYTRTLGPEWRVSDERNVEGALRVIDDDVIFLLDPWPVHTNAPE